MKKYFLLAVVILASAQFGKAQCNVMDSNQFPFVYNGHIYLIVKEARTWGQAAQCAFQEGGYLMVIDDQLENDTLAHYLGVAGITNANTVAPDGGGASYVWIGGNDIANEGTWLWDSINGGSGRQFWQGKANGNAVNGAYTNWGNEPDDFQGKQDGLAYAITNWPLGQAEQWNDVDISNNLYFVIEIVNALSVPDKATGQIEVFPNPTQDNIIIDRDLNNEISEIKLIDITGKTVKLVTENLDVEKININISDLAKGIYFVNVNAANGTVVEKIIVD